MTKLTKREDEFMQLIWKLGSAFIRDIVEAFPEPKPHYNTVATLVKILVKKGVLVSEKFGNMHKYSPVQDFNSYREGEIKNIKERFFENSLPKMIAHFARKEKLTDEEREELIHLIKNQ